MTLQADLDEEDPSSREDSIRQQMWSKMVRWLKKSFQLFILCLTKVINKMKNLTTKN